jgi:hypothetical protein
LEESKNKSKKGILFLIIIIILILLLIIGGLVAYILIISKDDKAGLLGKTDETVTSGKIGYEESVVLDNPESLQEAVDGMTQRVAEGTMALEMKMEAYSLDGVNFACQIGNPATNSYDMFVVIYRDDTQEEIYRSGLIPTGKHLEKFSTIVPIKAGSYKCTLVYNQVEDDQETIHSQVNVGLTLVVSE